MKKELEHLQQKAMEMIENSNIKDELEKIRVEFLGKKGQLTTILRGMGQLSPEERPAMGQIVNEVRDTIEKSLKKAFDDIKEKEKALQLKREVIDVTIPGVRFPLGGKHPISITIDEISKIFISMGYQIAEGPEVETVYNNFDALNAPKTHPSRDITDTFYIGDDILLRTQTSPVQIRTLQSQEPPIKIISPGRCFRCDTPDATHSPMFHQVEGLLVDKGVTMADLKGTLDAFAKQLFGSSIKTKLRPHHFPFTEPSAEVDVSCFKCGGKGCRVCKGSGWIEILGAGMVHPNVLREGNIDTEIYSGFAFGMGVERIAMLKYEVDDIRLFYENDMRFIDQFK
jgi:phenylalanyl-tRNA synthetase alpha chain